MVNMQQRIGTGKSSFYSTKFHIVLQNTSNKKIHSKRVIAVGRTWYSSTLHRVQQIEYNNVYIKFKTRYYTILSSLYRIIFWKQLLSHRKSRLGNREWLKQWKYLSFMEIGLFVFLMEASQFSKFDENESKHN